MAYTIHYLIEMPGAKFFRLLDDSPPKFSLEESDFITEDQLPCSKMGMVSVLYGDWSLVSIPVRYSRLYNEAAIDDQEAVRQYEACLLQTVGDVRVYRFDEILASVFQERCGPDIEWYTDSALISEFIAWLVKQPRYGWALLPARFPTAEEAAADV